MFASSWAFAVGTWWCSSWKAVLVSIRCWKWWGLWRDAQRCCVCSELDQGRASLHSSRYFPRIVMSHSLKPSMTFMIYGWNAGRIFHGLLCVPSLLLYQISYTIKKKKLQMLPKNCFSAELCVWNWDTTWTLCYFSRREKQYYLRLHQLWREEGTERVLWVLRAACSLTLESKYNNNRGFHM